MTARDADDAARFRPQRRAGDAIVLGLTLMISSTLIVPIMDVIAKYVGEQGVPALQVGWFRFAVQAAILVPILLMVAPVRALWPKRPWLAAARGALISIATVLFFTALQFMPLVESMAIFFVEPLILTLLSAVFLSEQIGWRRLAAVVIGFAGAMLIVQPKFLEVGWPALLPLATAVCFAFYLLLTKIMAAEENALTLHLWAGVVGCFVLTIIIALGTVAGVEAMTPVAMTSSQWALLGVLGIVGAAAHFLIVLAFRHAPASLLAPFQYMEIVSATLLGFLVFGDFPGPITWVGVGLIVGSGVFIFWRERRQAMRDRAE